VPAPAAAHAARAIPSDGARALACVAMKSRMRG
jgi:hypothetical protein